MIEPTPEQIEAFKREWAAAEWEGDRGNRVRRGLVAAAGAAPQEPSLSDAADALRENAREIEDAQLAAHGMIDPITNAVIAGIKQSAAMVCELAGRQVSTVTPVQVDEAKLAEVIEASAGEWGDASHVPDVLAQYISRDVVEWLRSGGR